MKGVYERIPGSGIWWIRYADENGKERREKVGTKRNAEALYRKRKTTVLAGRKLPENLRKAKVTFEKIAKAAISDCERTGRRDVRTFTSRMNVLMEAFGERAADSITPQDVGAWLATQAKSREWSAATQNRFKTVMSKAYSLAMRNDPHMLVNPARLTAKAPEHNTRIRFVTDAEQKRIIKAITELYPAHLPAFLVAVHTGMRQGEQFTLKWENVDLKRKIITLPRTKSGKARHIPMNTVVHGLLVQLAQKKEPDGFVFRSERYKGKAIRDPKRWWQAVLKEAKVKDLRWHDLRHTFASRLVMAGVDMRTVQELMGHSDANMTARYAHLSPEHNTAAIERLVSQK